MVATHPISLWDATAEEPDHSATFVDAADVDVAIVGGGFTGLSTALHSAERGLSAHVLEARQIGYGGSGRNVGLVNAGVWHPPAAVRQALGDTYGPRFVSVFSNGPQMVFDLIERHQIRCEATRYGTIHAAHAASGFRDLRARHAEWQRLGQPVDLLGADETQSMTGSRAFAGGLLDHRAGTINPMGYCRGLARAAKGAGATISTDTPVQAMSHDQGRWRLDTAQGSLRARTVVLATNAYTDRLWPGLDQVYTKIPYFQLATHPLPDHAARILPGRQGLWDTGKIMFNLRWDVGNRLLIGSMGRISGTESGGMSHRWAQKRLSRLFPDLGPVSFERAWHGEIAMTPDHLPKICQLAPNLFTAIGYNGRGITTGTIFGKCLAGLAAGDGDADLPLPLSTPKSVPSAPIMSRVYETAFWANQFLRGF